MTGWTDMLMRVPTRYCWSQNKEIAQHFDINIQVSWKAAKRRL